MRVVTIVGTRPELIKLSRVIAEFDISFDHVLVHTGQNFDWELNGIFFKEMSIRKPDHFLEAHADTPSATVARVIEKTDALLGELRPDAMLLLGDTNSCLAAYPAKRRKIPIFHMEAGNRCFDLRVPEEINRRIVDHLSDINLTYSEHARRYLLAEGLRPDSVMVTGSPMREVLEYYKDAITASPMPQALGLEPGRYFVWSTHREENIDDAASLGKLVSALGMLVATWGLPVIFSVHPRTRQRLAKLGAELPDLVQQHKPFGFFDYIRLQQHALCTLSDSGTLTEESSLLNFPAVMLRQAHERPEGMDEATVIMSGLDPERIKSAVQMAVRHQESVPLRPFRLVPSYEPTDVSRKVARIVASYVDYVNRTNWRKIVC
ncbi:UDP-N-acetylglucosamine 2-epimerase (non-hydrolysing) [Desulfonatronum zhilinae]|nr:UDP-N-acetylglucosamine 2-epimerase (non-hydrolysing) [Desulfonatronum zhilinae]